MGLFIFLDQTRFDITDSVTVLGCTLFSRISNEQRESVALCCSDFSEIEDWTVDARNSAHQSTMLEAANDPRQLQDVAQVQLAFVTDLSDQVCWTSTNFRLWAFGHAHFNWDFEYLVTKKRAVAKRKGYRKSGLEIFDPSKVVIVETLLESEAKT